MTRIISCQGSIQLVNQLAASELSEPGPHKDYLVIHDLSSPATQHFDFAVQIERCAKLLHRWQSIIYLDPDSLRRLGEGPGTLLERLAELRNWVGTDATEELLLNTSVTSGSQLLRLAYPNARRIGCGDGLGTHCSTTYYLPSLSANDKTIWAWFERRRRGLSFRCKAVLRKMFSVGPKNIIQKSDQIIHEYRLLLPGLFDEPSPLHRRPSARYYLQAFDKIGELLSPSEVPELAKLELAVGEANEVVVLLTSNLFEAKRMSLENELLGYKELMLTARNMVPSSRKVLLVIKPHPRDSSTKVQLLLDRASVLYDNVVVLASPTTFYLPFEAIYARFLAKRHHIDGRVSVICVSSACLSLAYLYHLPCTIGFGEDLVKQLFLPTWHTKRIRHETDLCQALNSFNTGSSELFAKVS